MTVSTLSDVLNEARKNGYAVPGLVVLGWEDIGAFVAAAEAENAPIILQAGPGCRRHTPLSILGKMFRYHAETANVPVVCHLDHGYEIDEISQAIDAGFSSVMIDGSQKPLRENIAITAKVVEMAHQAGISVEGEIGVVGYQDGTASQGTEPAEAVELVAQTGLDALAISAGNTHLQTKQAARINQPLIKQIASQIECPLVLHGGSGIPHEVRRQLAQDKLVTKFNIGTELRQIFGRSLRQHLAEQTDDFDRLSILSATHEPMMAATRAVIASLR